MEKPILYLHIGSNKTGTSAIQTSLSFNREYLQNLDVFVPGNKNNDNDPFLATVHWQFASTDSGVGTPPEIYLEDYLSRFRSSGCSRMIISSESAFHNRPYIDFDRAKEWIKKHFHDFNIKIICYLRRQDFYLEAMYNQIVKMLSYNHRDPVEMLFRVHFDKKDMYPNEIKTDMSPFFYFLNNSFPAIKYDKIISRFADFFGKENIIIRPYEKSQMPNGLIHDFYSNALSLTDIQISGLKPVGIVNESLSRDVLEFKLASGIDDRDLFECVNGLLGDKLQNTNVFFTYEERRRLLGFCKEGNAYLAYEYLDRDDGRLFYDNITELDPYHGLTKENAMEISKAIIPILNCYYKDSGSIPYNAEIESETATTEQVIESTRKLYFRDVSKKYVHAKTTDVLESYKSKTVEK